jgi:HlyD family secretion protein
MPNRISEFRTKFKELPRSSKILAMIAAALVGFLLLALVYSSFIQPLITRSGQSSATQGQFRTALVKRGDFDNSIQTSGSVRSNQTAVLVWQTNGTVDTVNVKKGDVVKSDDVLAKLDSTTMPQGVILAEVQLVSAQRALDTLLSSSQARANAELALVKAQKAVDDAVKHRRSLEYRRASDETIDIAHAHLIQANDALDTATSNYDANRNRSENSLTYAAALAAYAKARQAQIQAQYNYDYVSQLPDPLDVQEADSKVLVAQANLLQAKTDWERVKDGPNKDDVAAAQAQVNAAQATLNMGQISAPFAGTVTQAISKVGDQVTAGTLAFEVDDLGHLLIDVAVGEVDINRIQLDQPVTLTFDAIPGKEFSAKVTDIGQVGKATGGSVNYQVTVEVTDPDDAIKPGMTVNAVINTEHAQNVLYIPSQAILTRDGQQIVYLLKDGTPIPVVVLPGAAVDGKYTIIARSAIQEGDTVITNPAGLQ